jgi:hypothetical protein
VPSFDAGEAPRRSTSSLGDLRVTAVLNVVHVLVAWWAVICVLLLLSGIFVHLSFRRLRQSHSDIWKKLGEPHGLGDFRTYYPARKFVWSKQCRNLDDVVLTRRARFSYYSGMTAAALGLALAATLAVAALLRAL